MIVNDLLEIFGRWGGVSNAAGTLGKVRKASSKTLGAISMPILTDLGAPYIFRPRAGVATL